MSFLRVLSLVMVMMVVVLAGGCRTRVNFSAGAPYPTGFDKVNDAVIVSFPDAIKERTYKVRVGSLWEAHTFVMPVMEAYQAETTARMNGVFSRGVTMTSHKSLEELDERRAQYQEAKSAELANTSTETRKGEELDEEVTQSELDRILADLEKKEKGEGDVDKSEAELVDEALRQASMEMVEQKGASYLLVFRDALFGMPEQRIMVSFSVQLIDRRTGNVLVQKRYQGRSQRFDPNRNNKTNQAELVALTRMAFAGAMGQMTEDIARATGVWEPRR